MPLQSQLKLDQTFQSQEMLVKGTVIPTIKKVLDLSLISVSEKIIYDIIHICHKHKREAYNLKKQSKEVQDKDARRKHRNYRRSS
ncbi:32573_t:CDS:1, partial [Racocetra persica]